MKSARRSRQFVAGVYAGASIVILAALAYFGQFPNWWEWLLFGLVFAAVEFRSVMVNDHMAASSGAMVTIAAAVVFGQDAVTLGVASMMVFGAVTWQDVKERRWFQPIANFGVLVMSASLAATVLRAFLPAGEVGRGDVGMIALGAALAAVVHGTAQLLLVSLAVRTAFRRRNLRPWSRMATIMPSTMTMGAVGGVLGVVYLMLGPVALPLIFGAFFVGHYGLGTVAELREAHEATLRGFIKALEAKDIYTRGHTERVAYFAQITAEEMGFRGDALDRVRVAALIHDVGKLAVPRELIRKKGPLTAQEYATMQEHAHLVEEILHRVEFLAPMVEIASAHHARFDGGGYGGRGHVAGERPSVESRILAVADAFDAMTSTRSYRMALSQAYAIGELRRGAGSQFDPDVVEAFVRALSATGEKYGTPHISDEQEARARLEKGVAEVG